MHKSGNGFALNRHHIPPFLRATGLWVGSLDQSSGKRIVETAMKAEEKEEKARASSQRATQEPEEEEEARRFLTRPLESPAIIAEAPKTEQP